MRRLSPCIALAVLAIVPAVASAQESYTIKVKRSSKGTLEKIQSTETNVEKTKVTDNQGNVVEDKNNTTVTAMTLKQATLERPDVDKHPTSLKNTYEKVQITLNGMAQSVPYEGKSVLIDKKGDKFAFRLEGGADLVGNDAEWLNQEFNSPGDDGSTVDRLMFPTKAVKVGETWRIPLDEIAKGFAKRSLILDTDKCTATGKLVKVFMKDGHQFGEITFSLNLPVKSIKTDNGDIAIKGAAAVKMELNGTGCIDGSLTDSLSKMSMSFVGEGVFPADNPQVTVSFSNVMTREKTTTEIQKK
jgi:hypothetical protein